jgi:NAD(P)-dependent dehydrogenase (short-subunit alcohol dehydrogenase family)
MNLDSSVAAVVTGGASGLGEGTARMLAAKGVKVAILDMNAERGEAVAKIGGVFCILSTSPTTPRSTPPWPRPAPPTASRASWSTAPASPTRPPASQQGSAKPAS